MLSTEHAPAREGSGPKVYQLRDDKPSSHGVTPAPTAATKCKVGSFGMEFGKWNVSWPGWFSSKSTVRLPVEFELALEKGVGTGDCVIGQDRRGRVEMGTSVEEFPTWTSDSSLGFRYWWDGSRWNAGNGDWDWSLWNQNYEADFEDQPGFNDVNRSAFPLYWGGVGHKGHFEFLTYVMDKATGAIVRRLTWGILIDYSAPKTGRRYFYR